MRKLTEKEICEQRLRDSELYRSRLKEQLVIAIYGFLTITALSLLSIVGEFLK